MERWCSADEIAKNLENFRKIWNFKLNVVILQSESFFHGCVNIKKLRYFVCHEKRLRWEARAFFYVL